LEFAVTVVRTVVEDRSELLAVAALALGCHTWAEDDERSGQVPLPIA
jgi:hypothetical protein